MNTKIIDYESLPVKDLFRVNNQTKLMVMASSIVFFLVSGISCLFAYSFDPLLAMCLVSFTIGVFVLFMVIFFVYGKIIFLLKLLNEA